jgi:hypothetical protein
LNQIISSVFGSPQFFGKLVKGNAWFAIVTHVAEGLYVVYHAIRSMKLKWSTAGLWFLLVALYGFPITSEFTDLLRVHNDSKASKKKE